MNEKITHIRVHRDFKIHINDVLHFNIRNEEYIGCQSWLDGKKISMYYIEVYTKSGNNILLEYDNEEIWKNVLNLIDSHL
jgi:hypothetical protein